MFGVLIKEIPTYPMFCCWHLKTSSVDWFEWQVNEKHGNCGNDSKWTHRLLDQNVLYCICVTICKTVIRHLGQYYTLRVRLLHAWGVRSVTELEDGGNVLVVKILDLSSQLVKFKVRDLEEKRSKDLVGHFTDSQLFLGNMLLMTFMFLIVELFEKVQYNKYETCKCHAAHMLL